jgi:Lon protease-like protein
MEEIALFPLDAVLFPGGLLPLRIFEPRYLDMVRRCVREETVFGVVLIHAGSDISADVTTAGVGTSARIVDFQSLSDGLLGILCRGERRFRTLTRRIARDGLHLAAIEWIEEQQARSIPQEYQSLVPVLQRVLASLGNIARFIEPRYDDAGWVSNRFAELLPIDRLMQQRLLELDDPLARLQLLAPMIETGGD